MRIRSPHLVAAFIAGVLITGCSTTRRLEEGQYLLKKNKIEMSGSEVSKSDLESIIKQKPNKEILFFPFYLHAYNLPDPDKIPKWKEKKNAKRDRKNARRMQKGKEPKPYKRTKAEWLRDVVGEPPVLVDSTLTARSRDQIRLFMQKEGYFRVVVTDSTVLHDHKATVHYRIQEGEPYRLRKIGRTVDDPVMMSYMMMDTVNTLLHTGDRFRSDVLDQERNRLTDHYKELGYLYFSRDLMFYDLDTSAGTRQVDATLRIERPLARNARKLQGTREGTIIYLDQVYINMTRREVKLPGIVSDSLHVDGYHFLFSGMRPEFRPQSLLCGLSLKPGERYRKTNVDRTYLRLSNLHVFDRIDIAFDTLATGPNDRVNCRIDLVPSKRQSFSAEGFLTNNGGLLGTQGSLTYHHRNLFRSMGSIQASITVGLEAQRSITGADQGSDAGTAVGENVLFNTVEIGPDLTVRFPHFLIPFTSCDRFGRSAAPRTLINVGFSFQRRPDYTRTLARFSYGYEWSASRYETIGVFFPELNVVKIPKMDQEFEDYLVESNDPVLLDSYTDHIILNFPRLVHTWNTQGKKTTLDHFYNKASLECAGSILALFDLPTVTDTLGNSFRTLAGIRYAEYIKVDNDFRFYHTIHDKSSAVFRVAGGVGVPYGNLNVLPFESSFFVGGANGLRAWRARSVGPGSYSAPLVAYDRTGEVRLEGNAEYRFKLVGFFEGALFADVGNIWLLKEDPFRPGSGIESDLFSELAVGVGAGVRLNFDFFLIRFDLGLQTKDPSLPKGERWIFQPKDTYDLQFEEAYGYSPNYHPQVNFNLGIGYPF